jgi:hypothetical protein
MAGTKKRIGPLALTTALTTNVYNNASALIYDVIRHIHVANKTGAAATFSLWIGATGANAAGTELIIGHSVPANDEFDLFLDVKMASTDFLVGGSNTATALTITVTSDQFVV